MQIQAIRPQTVGDKAGQAAAEIWGLKSSLLTSPIPSQVCRCGMPGLSCLKYRIEREKCKPVKIKLGSVILVSREP